MVIIAQPHTAMHQRAQAVLDKVSGVVSMYQISSYELTFLRDMVNKQIIFGSPKQIQLMVRIEENIKDIDDDND